MLKKLVEGKITNDEFFSLELGSHEDRAAFEIWKFGTTLCHDLYPTRLKGTHALSEGLKQTVRRCILFLDTDLEFEWPPISTGSICYWLFLFGAVLEALGVVVAPFQLVIISTLLVFSGSLSLVLAWLYRAQVEKARLEAYWLIGEKSVWPFFRQSDYDELQERGDGDSSHKMLV